MPDLGIFRRKNAPSALPSIASTAVATTRTRLAMRYTHTYISFNLYYIDTNWESYFYAICFSLLFHWIRAAAAAGSGIRAGRQLADERAESPRGANGGVQAPLRNLASTGSISGLDRLGSVGGFASHMNPLLLNDFFFLHLVASYVHIVLKKKAF